MLTPLYLVALPLYIACFAWWYYTKRLPVLQIIFLSIAFFGIIFALDMILWPYHFLVRNIHDTNLFTTRHFTFDPLAAFNLYRINGVYAFRDLQSIFPAFLALIPLGFVFLYFFPHHNTFRDILWTGVMISLLIVLLHVSITIIAFVFYYSYTGGINTGKLLLHMMGFIVGIWLYKGLMMMKRNSTLKVPPIQEW